MFSRLALLPPLLALVLSQPDDPAGRDLKAMQGTWVMASLEVNGKDVPAEKLVGTVLTVKGDVYSVKVKDRTTDCRMRLDPKRKPREVDMIFAEPGGGEKVLKGIYKIDADTITFARGLNANQERPGQFATWPDTTYFVVTWRRK
jgi:uncharacterized protein (TIGR03067 family)